MVWYIYICFAEFYYVKIKKLNYNKEVKGKMINKLLKNAVLILGVALLVTSIPVSAQAKTKHLSKNIQVGDTVYFGKYEQDGNKKNGKEKIEWQVLEKKGNKAMLISKMLLDVQPYNNGNREASKAITWEKSTLRKWLNKKFIKEAFSSKEIKKIQNSKIKNKDNEDFGSKGGKDTTDKVFLLSIDEAENYFKTDENSIAQITNYGIKRIAKVLGMSEKTVKKIHFEKSNNWWYWLRSPGNGQNRAVFVKNDGGFYYSGNYVTDETLGCRPVLWVELR